MGTAEWGVVAGIATSILGGLAAVYWRIAVLSTTVGLLSEMLKKIEDNHLPHIYERLRNLPCDTHGLRLTAIEKRIERE